MIPLMSEGDETAVLIFRSEGLKPVETGKGSSAREVSDTGVWGRRDPTEASAEEGRQGYRRFRGCGRSVHRALEDASSDERVEQPLTVM